MTDNPQVTVLSEARPALHYLTDCMRASLLITKLGISRLLSECNRIEVVTASVPPAGQLFDSGWGGRSGPCDDWVVHTIVEFLRTNHDGLVLFDDVVTSPTDQFLDKRPHPPYWYHDERVFWPVTNKAANFNDVEQVMAWGVSRHAIINFCIPPAGIQILNTTMKLSPDILNAIAASTTSLITSVYDGEGYMVWHREQSNAVGN